MNNNNLKRLALLIPLILTLSITASAGNKKTKVNWATFNLRLQVKGDSLNNWPYRRDRVVNYILDNKVDIVGMQECLPQMMSYLDAKLKDYSYIGVCREDGKLKGEACPIFYLRDRFEALESNTFWLSQYPDSIGFKGWDGACTRVATWVKLRDKKTGKEFIAINTHLDHKGVQARNNAAKLIMDRIKPIAGNLPVVLTGDFNTTEDSDAYRTFTASPTYFLDSHKIAKTTTGPTYTWHNFGRDPLDKRNKIDFIFVTQNIEVKSSNISQEHTIDPNNPATNWGYLSDHNPIIATLSF